MKEYNGWLKPYLGEMRELYAMGKNFSEIAQILADRGVASPSSSPWRPQRPPTNLVQHALGMKPCPKHWTVEWARAKRVTELAAVEALYRDRLERIDRRDNAPPPTDLAARQKERRERAVALREKRMNFRAIGRELGISGCGAISLVRAEKRRQIRKAQPGIAWRDLTGIVDAWVAETKPLRKSERGKEDTHE